MTKQIDAAGAMKFHDGLTLCAQRGFRSGSPGLWVSPGGKIGPSETQCEALEREIREELIADVQVGDRVENTVHEYPLGEMTLTIFNRDVLSDDITFIEHGATVWFAPAERATLDWAPADVPTVQTLSGLLVEPTDPSSGLTLFGREQS